MVKWIIIAVLLLPVAEIATFVLVALAIGFGWAVALMAATSALGFIMLRRVGRGQLTLFRVAVTQNNVTGVEANAASFLNILAGLLLLLPGFLTDLLGLLLLIAPVRRWCASRFRGFVTVAGQSRTRTVVDLAPEEWEQVPDRELPHRRDPPERR